MATTKKIKKPRQTLFEKILQTYFPKDRMAQAGVFTSNMFLAHMSNRQTVSLINRRLIENFRLNMYDIAIDPFDIKIGIGEKTGYNQNDVDLYYSYNSAANFNGYTFFSPNTIASCMAMVFSVSIGEAFTTINEEYESAGRTREVCDDYHRGAVYTVYFLTFSFVGRIKDFRPTNTPKEDFDQFVALFFSYYEHILKLINSKISLEHIQHIKHILVLHDNLFFGLIAYFKTVRYMMCTDQDEYMIQEFHTRIFWEVKKKKKYAPVYQEYVDLGVERFYTTDFAGCEHIFIDFLTPNDVLIRLLFGSRETLAGSREMITAMYDYTLINDLFQQIAIEPRTSNEHMYTIIRHALNMFRVRKSFFGSIKKYINESIRYEMEQEEAMSAAMQETSDDELMSAVYDDEPGSNNQQDEMMSMMIMQVIEQIPHDLNDTAIATEKMLFFYLGLIGNATVARGDSMEMRLLNGNIIDTIANTIHTTQYSDTTVNFFSTIMLHYAKNVYFYTYIMDKIRSNSNKGTFELPIYAGNKIDNYSHVSGIHSMVSSYISILMQDLNEDMISISINHDDILDIYEKTFARKIATIAKKTTLSDLIRAMWGPIDACLTHSPDGVFVPHLTTAWFPESKITVLKNRLYTLHYRVFADLVGYIKKNDSLTAHDTLYTIGILAGYKETLIGFLLAYTYLLSMEKAHQQSYNTKALLDIYISGLIHIESPDDQKIYASALRKIQKKYENIFTLWAKLDENTEYLHLILSGWVTESASIAVDHDILCIEDRNRLFATFKHITYYNKRYLFPV